MTPILNSERLKTLLADSDKLKAKAKRSQAEATRLTKLVSPQWLDATVTRTTDAVKEREQAPGVIATAEQDEAARQRDILSRTLAGEPLIDSLSIKEQIERETRQWAAYETAIEFLNGEIDREKTSLAIQYCAQRKPEHDELMRQLCKALLDVLPAWSKLHGLKRDLIDSGIGLRGLCDTLPEAFLSTPNNPYSEMADFFRAAKRGGFIKEVPAGLRL